MHFNVVWRSFYSYLDARRGGRQYERTCTERTARGIESDRHTVWPANWQSAADRRYTGCLVACRRCRMDTGPPTTALSTHTHTHTHTHTTSRYVLWSCTSMPLLRKVCNSPQRQCISHRRRRFTTLWGSIELARPKGWRAKLEGQIGWSHSIADCYTLVEFLGTGCFPLHQLGVSGAL